jgi:RNA polymerase sporulation-specific sigma factor
MEMDQVIQLIKETKEGNRASQAKLHDHFDGLFKYYADKYAKKYSRLIEFDDLVQEAHIGLMKATRNFNPEKVKQSMSITTYVYFYMLDALQSACDYRNVDLTESIFNEDAKGYADMIPDTLEMEDEILGNEILQEEMQVRRDYLDTLISKYDPKDRAIIKLRLGVTGGIPRTLSEIAHILGLGIETIRKREQIMLADILSHRVNIRRA